MLIYDEDSEYKLYLKSMKDINDVEYRYITPNGDTIKFTRKDYNNDYDTLNLYMIEMSIINNLGVVIDTVRFKEKINTTIIQVADSFIDDKEHYNDISAVVHLVDINPCTMEEHILKFSRIDIYDSPDNRNILVELFKVKSFQNVSPCITVYNFTCSMVEFKEFIFSFSFVS